MSCCDTFNRLCAGTGTGCDPSSGGGGGGGGGVVAVNAGTNIYIPVPAVPVVNVSISSTLDMNGQNIIDGGDFTCGTLNYTTLNPPISVGVTSVSAGTNIYILDPAIPIVNVSVSTTLDLHNNDLSGIVSFNSVGVQFNNITNVTAIGNSAGLFNTGYDVHAIGYQTAYQNSGNYVNAIGTQPAYQNTGSSVIAIGYRPAIRNKGDYVNAIGSFAAWENSGSNVNAIGAHAAYQNSGSNVNAIGLSAAIYNKGSNVNAFGSGAAYQNNGSNVNAIGYQTAYGNTGAIVNAIGDGAASGNTGAYVNAIGSGTAGNNSGSYVNAIGNNALFGNTGTYVDAIGQSAAVNNRGSNVVAIGYEACSNSSGINVNAIGQGAASCNIGNWVNAIGDQAAYKSKGSNINAIGNGAAYQNSGAYVNAFGNSAGQYNTGNNCTFIGTNPNTAIVNTISNRLIMYSTSDTPFLYGDTSNISLGIGTTTLSATLTVSGKICATGILDTLNSTGTANQVLTAGPGGDGLVWATVSAAIGVTAGRNINIPSPDFSVVSVLIDSSLEMNGQQIHTDSSLSIIAQDGISLITENDGINMTASTNIALVCVQNVTVSSANVNIGNTLNAIGIGSAYQNSGSNVNAFGFQSALKNRGSNVNALGYNSAVCNNGYNVNAIGESAAYKNTGVYVNAIGYKTASGNIGSYVNAIGYQTACENTGSNVNAFGNGAVVDAFEIGTAYRNSGSFVNAIGHNTAFRNSGNYVNAFGYSAGIRNTGNNCTFIGTNPNADISNTLSDRFIIYSTSATPFLYGDTSNMSLGIGTTTLSATLTVSGKICATGILDTLNSTGTANQVLTAGTGGGLIWATAIGNIAGRHINIVGNEVSLLINSSLETNGYQIHSSGSLPIVADTGIQLTANNGKIDLSASTNVALSCISNVTISSANVKINTNMVAIGNSAASNNKGSNVNAFGNQAGIRNTGNNCTFIGTNPNADISNTLSDRFIVYSSSDTPFLYGDTSNMSLGIGTTTLSATLTVSGKICATGILDTLNSSGTANQVLTAGTGGGLVWTTAIGNTIILDTNNTVSLTSSLNRSMYIFTNNTSPRNFTTSNLVGLPPGYTVYVRSGISSGNITVNINGSGGYRCYCKTSYTNASPILLYWNGVNLITYE